MSPTSRRTLLYWLLLLVPALVVGGGAIRLLRLEEARLRQQGEDVAEARRAAVTAQARLIVENVELFVGDAQAGLLDTLGSAPGQGLDAFLDRWEQNNPLVRTAFRARPDGSLIRPAADASREEARGFVRRFARELARQPPWGSELSSVSPVSPALEKKSAHDSEVRKLAAQNVMQAQSARRDLQQLASAREYALANGGPRLAAAAPPAGAGARPAPGASPMRATSEAAAPLGALSADEYRQPARTEAAWAEARAGKAEADKGKAVKDAFPETRGWRPRVLDGRLHVLGWVRPAGASEYRGLELELAALVNRLRGALPAEVGFGEGYALRDGQGRTLHQSGAVAAGAEPLVKVALGETLLPGWEVVGYFSGTTKGDSGAGFFWLGALLVGIFVAAILAGGSLLWWEARRSEAEAAQKTSFVANVSHEFKTPLTTIRLYAELLELGRVRDAAQAGEYLRTIGRETQRLARLVNNALDFSRLEQGRKKYALESVEVRAALARLLDTLAPRAAEAGVVLRPQVPDAATEITTDRDAFEQIVLNLLDNAFKYGAAGGEVGVGLSRRSDGGVEICVSDRGPGVPAEHRDRIFEKFHRVDESLTAEKTGTGLGLSIARQLARGLGGDLRYQSREGGGATFILSLP